MKKFIKRTASSTPLLHHPVEIVFAHIHHNETQLTYEPAVLPQKNLSVLAYVERKNPTKCFFCQSRHATETYARSHLNRSIATARAPPCARIPLSYHYTVYVHLPVEDLLNAAYILWTPPGHKMRSEPWILQITGAGTHDKWSLSCLQTVYIP